MHLSEPDGSFNPSHSIQESESSKNGGVRINRQTFTWADFNDQFDYHSEPKSSPMRTFRRLTTSCCTLRRCKNTFFRFFPFISVLGHYDWKRNFVQDLIAGLTVSAMHIPQGMAYGQLATLRPIHGLYISFFPVLLYFFFGTSRHLSIGSFAVISLMVAKVLDGELSSGLYAEILANKTAALNQSELVAATTPLMALNGTAVNSTAESVVHPGESEIESQMRIDLAVSLNLITGVFQIILGFLGAGFITNYLSYPFISGYTTGCAIHVFTSQLKYVFGVEVVRRTGAFKIYYTWRDVILNLTKTNFATLGMSAAAAVFLVLCKFIIDPRIKRYSPLPIPAELLLMILADVISYFCKLGPSQNVDIIGSIPTQFPMPRPPTYFSFQLILDSIPLVLVSFSLCISMGKLFARNYKYKISPNQEFFALGISNAISSFFDCYTVSASLSRSMVQASVGGQTQLASVISCGVILAVILYLGTLLEPLPTCILAVVVMVNLRGMFRQFFDLKKYWNHCTLDAITWCVAFLATVVVDVDVGLYVGVAFVLLTIIIQTAGIKVAVVRQAGNTELFAHESHYGNLASTCPAVVLRWSSPIYFATAEKFIAAIMSSVKSAIKSADLSRSSSSNGGYGSTPVTGVTSRHGSSSQSPKALVINAGEDALDVLGDSEDSVAVVQSPATDGAEITYARRSHSGNVSPPLISLNYSAVILDLSGVAFIDTVGLEAIKHLAHEFAAQDLDFILASCPDCVLKILATETTFEDFIKLNVFLTPIDALVAVKKSDLFANMKTEVKPTPKPKTSRASSRTSQDRGVPALESQVSLIQAHLATPNTESGDGNTPDLRPKDELAESHENFEDDS